MAGVLSRFSFVTAAFWLSVWKKWCLEKGIAKEIENYEPNQLNT